MQFLFDFGSPNTYFCHKVIQAVEARTEARFEYVPILLDGLLKLSAAQESGCGPVYVDAMYAAMWEDARNMNGDDDIAAVLHGAGLDGTALLAKAQEPSVKDRLVANTQSAFERDAGPAHSHSIVAGGLLDTSYTTRLMPRTSLMMRPDTRLSSACGSSAQSAVMKSLVCTARRATTFS